MARPGGNPVALSRSRRRQGRRARRAVGYVWFVLVALPTLLFSCGMSVDLGRVVVANREAANMADAAATAGALQYRSGQAQLDTTAATRAALDTWSAGQAAGSLGLVSAGTPDVAVTPAINPTTVTVTVHYRVTGLVFYGWFVSGGTSAQLTASSSAQICVPGQTTNTAGYCSRPPGNA